MFQLPGAESGNIVASLRPADLMLPHPPYPWRPRFEEEAIGSSGHADDYGSQRNPTTRARTANAYWTQRENARSAAPFSPVRRDISTYGVSPRRYQPSISTCWPM